MQKSNTLLMQEGRAALHGKWGLAVGGFFIYCLITGLMSNIPIVGGIFTLAFGGPFAYGISLFGLNLARNEYPAVEQLFKGFNQYTRTLIAYLLILLWVGLGFLLFIIPGIIVLFQYSMVYYIMIDNEEVRPTEALEMSKQMMDGHKMRLFYLWLHFSGYFFLCILTFGIGFLWFLPYFSVTTAKFYDDLKGDDEDTVLDLSEHLLEDF